MTKAAVLTTIFPKATEMCSVAASAVPVVDLVLKHFNSFIVMHSQVCERECKCVCVCERESVCSER